MKKLFFLLISLSFILVSCKSKEDASKLKTEPDDKPLQTEKDVNAQGTVNLKYNLQKGKKYVFLLSTSEDNKETLKADTTVSQNLFRKQVLKITFEVLNVDSDGSFDLNSTINHLKISMSDGKQTITFDSDKDANKKEQFGNYLAMVNNSFGVRIRNNGELLEITKMDKLVNKLLEYIGNQIPNDKKTEFINYSANSLKMQISQMVSQIFKPLPNKNIGIDTTWQVVNQAKAGTFDITTFINYKAKSFEKLNDDKLLVYEATLLNKITGKDKIIENGNEFRFDKPNIQGTSTTYFNLTKGCVQKSISNMSTYNSVSLLPKGGKFQVRSTNAKSSNIIEFLGIEN